MFISASSDVVIALIIISVFTRSMWPFPTSLSSSVLFTLFSMVVRGEESAVMLRLLFWTTIKSFEYEKLIEFSGVGEKMKTKKVLWSCFYLFVTTKLFLGLLYEESNTRKPQPSPWWWLCRSYKMTK